MAHSIKDPNELQRIYERRFSEKIAYRQQLWRTLCGGFFQKYVPADSTVLDLGCGYGEFINNISCAKKYAMDLNPEASKHLAANVTLIAQDCSTRWSLPDESINVIFTSNFFEHLTDKLALRNTLVEAARCLRKGGRLIALGPNIKYVNGAYWDFWDHFLCLTEASLAEALENNGYDAVESIPRFLPYTTVNQPRYPMLFLKLYLRLRLVWPLFGKQFLVVAQKR